MKVYVASKFGNRDAVRVAQALLREEGHVITYDWSGDDAPEIAGPCNEYMIPTDPEIARKLSLADVRGVCAADALIFLPTEMGGRGCYVETGIALACGVPTIVVGPCFNSIFMYALGVVRTDSIAEAIRDLPTLAERAYMDSCNWFGNPNLDSGEGASRKRSDSGEELRQMVLKTIESRGMQHRMLIDVPAHVLHDLFVDLSRAKAREREALHKEAP